MDAVLTLCVGYACMLTGWCVCCSVQQRKHVQQGSLQDVYERASFRLSSGQTGTAVMSMAKYDDRWAHFENWMICMDPNHAFTRRILRIGHSDMDACLEPFVFPTERFVEFLEFLHAGHQGKHHSVGPVEFQFTAGGGRDNGSSGSALPATVRAAADRFRSAPGFACWGGGTVGGLSGLGSASSGVTGGSAAGGARELGRSW